MQRISKHFGRLTRLDTRVTRGSRGVAVSSLTVETLEVRLCMDASGLSDELPPFAPQLGISPSSLVASPPVATALPRAAVSGPSKPVCRGADAAFTVSLSAAPGEGRTVSVRYNTVDGLARAGRQYVATGGVLEFTDSEMTKTIYVPTIAGAQSLNPKADRFGLKLSAPAGVKITNSSAIATITPSVLGLGISCTSVVEGDEGTKTATFVVSLGRPVSKTVTVDYVTADDTATVDDNDYVPVSGSLTFAPGETRKTISVDIVGDTTPEFDETFKVVLSNATNTLLQLPVGIATIRTDDGVPEIIHAFQITLDYATTLNGPVPKAVRDASEWAAARWAQVIIGDLPDINDPDLGFVDDFRMTVSIGLLGTATGTDGSASALANAVPLQFRNDASGLPWLGITGIDPSDAQDPELRNILLHEFGHALGFGALWGEKKLSLNAGPNDASTNPFYVGANAVREFNAVFHTSQPVMPIENMTAGLAGVYGDGSYGVHWRESVMGPELMTSMRDGTMPLSRITVAAMQDLGYTVDYAAADRFTPPPAAPPAAVRSAAFTAGASIAHRIGKSIGTTAFGSPARPAAIASQRPLTTEIAAQAAAMANTQPDSGHSAIRRPGLVSPNAAVSSASIQAVFSAWHGAKITAGSR